MSTRNLKRERFALELYAGKRPLDAMTIAGYTPRPEGARSPAGQAHMGGDLLRF